MTGNWAGNGQGLLTARARLPIWMYTNNFGSRRPSSNFLQERVLDVRHWTEALFSFTTTRDPSFRFENGQFTMIGLEVEGRPLLRAYSMASANYEDQLEFFSIKVPDGPLTSRLQRSEARRPHHRRPKATGTLLLDNLCRAEISIAGDRHRAGPIAQPGPGSRDL